MHLARLEFEAVKKAVSQLFHLDRLFMLQPIPMQHLRITP